MHSPPSFYSPSRSVPNSLAWYNWPLKTWPLLTLQPPFSSYVDAIGRGQVFSEVAFRYIAPSAWQAFSIPCLGHSDLSLKTRLSCQFLSATFCDTSPYDHPQCEWGVFPNSIAPCTHFSPNTHHKADRCSFTYLSPPGDWTTGDQTNLCVPSVQHVAYERHSNAYWNNGVDGERTCDHG